MITRKIGDLLENVEKGFIIHGCNAQGRMGSGIALSIRQKWPEVYTAYQQAYRKGYTGRNGKHVAELGMGTNIPVKVSPELVVINAITQRYYRGHSMSSSREERFVDYTAVAMCFHDILRIRNKYPEINGTVHFPLIGAGLANGDWSTIERLINFNLPAVHKFLWVLE